MTDKRGYIAFDFDGTLATYDKWDGDPSKVGEPITPMVDRVKKYLSEGQEVRILTARVYTDGTISRTVDAHLAEDAIRGWCRKHIGVILPVTCTKDYEMLCLYDDRCVQVEKNTGVILGKEF